MIRHPRFSALWLVVVPSLFLGRGGDAQQGHRGALISAIDSVVAAAMSAAPAAGLAVGVAQGGEMLLAKGYGFANVEHRVPVSAETVFRVGSITKQFTGVAVMQLVERGKLRLDQRLSEFLPDYPAAGRDITVEQLIDHTSGIKNYTAISPRLWLEDFRLDLTSERLIALFKDTPLDFAPGHGYNYSNSAFYLAGVIVERVSGLPYADYIARHLFEPVGMRSSAYCDQRAIVPHRASGYDLEDGELVNTRFISMYVPGPAGAICSTVLDLVKWQRALAHHRVLGAAALARLMEPARLANSSEVPYGGGLATAWLEGHRKVGHGGQVNGFTAISYFYPDDDVSVVVLSNGPTNPAGVEDAVARLVLGLPRAVVADMPVTETEIDSFTGSYRVGDDRALVFAADRSLHLRQGGPDAPAVPLRHQGDGLFVVGDPALTLRFDVHDGVAQRMLFTQAGIPIAVAERQPG